MNKITKIRENTNILTLLLTVFLTALLLCFRSEVKNGIYDGFILSYTLVIPTVFPFFILSDFFGKNLNYKRKGRISATFERLFLINSSALYAFLCGYICGFPMGVKLAKKLYDEQLISKEELELICPLVNNPSIIFVISGVGLGLFKSFKTGLVLYLSIILSSIIIGIALRKKRQIPLKSDINSRQTYILTDSIREAGLNSLYISSFVIFFSALLSIISTIIKNKYFLTLLYTLSEISNSVSLIYDLSIIDINQKISLTAFSLSFSGLCVFLQAFSFLPKEISKAKYIVIKLFQGFLSFVLTTLFISLI